MSRFSILSLAFLIVAISLLVGCTKESIDVSNAESVHDFNFSSKDSCIDQIDSDLLNPIHRAKSMLSYEFIKFKKPEINIFGQPQWKAAFSYNLNKTQLTVVPMLNQNADSVKTLFLLESNENKHKFYFIPKVSIQAKDNSESKVLELFSICECYIFCINNVLHTELRGGKIKCPTWGTSRWEKFLNWISNLWEQVIGDGDGGGGGGAPDDGGITSNWSGGIYTGGFDSGPNSNPDNNSGGGTSTGGTNGGSVVNETATVDLISKYYNCLANNAAISTLVWEMEFLYRDEFNFINKILDEALNMLCIESESHTFTPTDLQNEINRAFQRFCPNPGLTIESYISSKREITGWMVSHNHDLISTQIGNQAFGLLCNGGPGSNTSGLGAGNDFNLDPTVYYAQQLIYLALKAKYHLENPESICDWTCQLKLWLEAAYHVFINPIHILLDICGLIPVYGEPCDGINGVLYVLEGDGVNASIAFAGMLPIVGWAATVGKYVAVVVKTASGKTITLTLKIVDGLVDFGSYGRLRHVLDIPVGDPRQAHHFISWSEKSHDVIQTAARGNQNSTSVFHMNRPNNGLAVDAWRNSARPGEQAGHLIYNGRVKAGLNKIQETVGLNDPDLLLVEIGKFENYLRDLIVSNPNLHFNDIVFTYIP